MYSIAMQRDAGKLHDITWVAQCAHRLRARWPHVDPASLEEAAAELWLDEALRAMAAIDAAEAWLARGSRVAGERHGALLSSTALAPLGPVPRAPGDSGP